MLSIGTCKKFPSESEGRVKILEAVIQGKSAGPVLSWDPAQPPPRSHSSDLSLGTWKTGVLKGGVPARGL